MAKQSMTYTFENPNREEAVVEIIRQILIGKLMAQKRDGRAD